MSEEEVDIEENLEKLESIVKELENEQLDLEKSIELFEKGVKLAEEVKEGLSEAELRLKKVVESTDLDFEAEDFNL
ncbi:MAG: exodeoxyribonuclease VII small subunit [Candidatus Bipolaricaulota bacterium]|nr:exodeoxyribonuclease VII small subunit [Candidatus Bipolaricaulota bacterium]MBS3792735.1 exodeoxyribonuclease VII small subunit [Candidatus Bipolaricaulota bacterium]